ncbi:hypothetical protein DYB32_002070 [Aphanomyces invadans]|uniref:Dolichyl-phosphate-mannose--protein mannosyltransferase n=1 Tax=Aphanomyces invadans TaxID=157072 RepID=A0A3R7AD63_9STRA|nr:hypothetical protein DYB32_002070 [Aphanomyces invadans]
MLRDSVVVAAWTCLVAAYYASPFVRGPWEFIGAWDDSINFVDNALIQHPLSLASVGTMFQTVKINVYEPLAWLLKALVHSAFGMDSYAVRVATLGIHLVNATVLYATAARLLRMLHRPAPLGCFLGTLVYAVHPIHVEIVGWPSAQPYALAMLFTLLSFYTHLESVDATNAHHPCTLTDPVGLYVCSVLSKSAAILAPVGIVAMDVVLTTSHEKATHPPWRHKDLVRRWMRYGASQGGYVLAMAGLVSVTWHANADGAAVDSDIIHLTLSERAMKVVFVLMWPIRMFLWPTCLRFHYQLPPSLHVLDNSLGLLSAAAVVAITVGLKAQLHVAKCYMLLGQTNDACAIYAALYVDHPTYAHVLNNMGVCAWKHGRLRAARDYFVEAATHGTGLTRGDTSPQTNLALVDEWNPRTRIVARIMW